MLQIEWLVAATLTFNGVLIAFLVWAYHAPRFASCRMSHKVSMKVPWSTRARIMVTTSVLSLLTVFGMMRLAHAALIYAAPSSLWSILAEALLVLLVYDFAYYFLHRLMHVKKLMRWVHGVHHRARNPSALESFYLHPAELFAGLFLLFAATYVVGPVHVHAFAIAFFVYSTLNILVHSGLDTRKPWLAPIDFLARKHHVHHQDDFAKNYSSLTPLPDLLFGTAK